MDWLKKLFGKGGTEQADENTAAAPAPEAPTPQVGSEENQQ